MSLVQIFNSHDISLVKSYSGVCSLRRLFRRVDDAARGRVKDAVPAYPDLEVNKLGNRTSKAKILNARA